MNLPNIHPGEVLLEEFLNPSGISQNAVARAIGVPPRRINEIVLGKRAVSADTAIRLARYFGTSEQFWLGLQNDYDLENAHAKIGQRNIELIQPLQARSTEPDEGGVANTELPTIKNSKNSIRRRILR